MGLFSKIAFWKKDDDFFSDDFKDHTSSDPSLDPNRDVGNHPAFGDTHGKDPTQDPIHNTGIEQSSFGNHQSPNIDHSIGTGNDDHFDMFPKKRQYPFQQQHNATTGAGTTGDGTTGTESKETELILSKLDTLKAMIENINHKVEKIEKEVGESKNPKTRW